MTTNDSTPGAAGQGLLTGAAGRRTDPHEWRALGPNSPRWQVPGTVRSQLHPRLLVRVAENRPSAHEQVERADVLDRIAAFTDELNEMLTRDRNPLDSLHHDETDNASGVPLRARNADSLNLLANCKKALRAAAATIPT